MDHKVSMISRRDFLIGAAGTAGALLIHSCGDGSSGSASESPAVVMLEDVPLQAWHPETARFHHGVDRVLEILRDKGAPLLRTTGSHPMGGTGGIISPDDVVVIKVNGVGQFVSSTNTDILGGLVARILDHPDGFEGEVVIIDKYFFYEVPTRGQDANAEVREQNFDFVADALGDRVTTYMFGRMWPPWSWLPWGPGSLVFRPPVPYDPEPWTDGYVDLMTLFQEDPAFYCLSYPRFTTARGTRIDLRRGVYEGEEFHDRLRFIDVPVLKRHHWMGMTAALKNLFGILNIGTVVANIKGDPTGGVWERWLETHHEIPRGGLLGRFMRHIRCPDLTLVDAIRVPNHPGTLLNAKTLFASSDPVAVDHAAATQLMYPTPVEVTPCSVREVGRSDCQDPPPCLANPGYCERYRPDLEDDRTIGPERWGDPSGRIGTYLQDGVPVNALGQYLRTAAAAVTGRPDAAPGDYRLTRESF